jgi:hypothetical protein
MEIMMKKTESGRIRKIKQAAACALTLAFLLSACGMAKNSQTVSQSSYDAGAGQENYASYREDGGEYEAAREEGASVSAGNGSRCGRGTCISSRKKSPTDTRQIPRIPGKRSG